MSVITWPILAVAVLTTIGGAAHAGGASLEGVKNKKRVRGSSDLMRVGKENIRRSLATSDTLPIDNVKWVHSQGHICLQTNAVQFLTYEEDTIFVQEIIGPKMYSYHITDTEALYKDAALHPDTIEGMDTSWIDPLVGIKYNCQVEDIDPEEESLLQPEATLIEMAVNGTSTWEVGGWLVSANKDLVAQTLESLRPDEDDEEGGDDTETLRLKIIRIETCGKTLVGCDLDTEAGTEALPITGPSDVQMNAAAAEAGIEKPPNGTRALQDWSSLASISNWCGKGTDLANAPCPGSGVISYIPGYDRNADRACRRHDHGTKFHDLGFAKRMECIVDKDLYKATRHPLVHAIYGPVGLASTWGCIDNSPYKCFKWGYKTIKIFRRRRRIRYPRGFVCECSSERVRYGPFRYENNRRNTQGKWGYRKPDKTCSDDLWGGCSDVDKECTQVYSPKGSSGGCASSKWT